MGSTVMLESANVLSRFHDVTGRPFFREPSLSNSGAFRFSAMLRYVSDPDTIGIGLDYMVLDSVSL